jgi:antitoxin ParD1/3/4
MASVTLELPDDVLASVEAAVSAGRYGSVSDVVGAALLSWHADQLLGELDVEAVRAAIEEGRASGPTIPAEQVFDRLLERLHRMAGDA